jgi:WD40 repeat protein
MSRLLFTVIALCTLSCVLQEAPGQPPTPPGPRVDALGDPLPDGAMARLGVMRFRHGGKNLLGFSHDGKRLLFHDPGAVHAMDAQTGKFSQVLRYKDEAKPAPSSLLFGGGDQVQPAALSGDGKVLVYIDENEQSFGIVDALAGKETQRIKSATLFNNAMQLSQVRYQLSRDGKLLLVFPSRNAPGNSVAWANTATGQKLHAVAGPQGNQWRKAQLSPDGKQVAALCPGDNKLHLYDSASGKEIRTLAVERPNDFDFLLRDDGKTLIGWTPVNSNVVVAAKKGEPPDAGPAGAVALYDTTDDKQLKEIRKFGNVAAGGTVVLSPDGKELFVQGGNTITQWTIDSGKQIQVFEVGRLDVETRFPNQGGRPPVLSHDGKQLAVPNGKTLAVYNVATGALLTPPASGGAVVQVRFAPDGQTLFASNMTQNNWIWDVKEAKPLRKLALPPKMAAPSQGGLFVSLFGELVLSSDGKYAAQCLGEHGVDVWDTASGKHLYTLAGEAKISVGGEAPPTAVAFAPEDYLLATAGADGVVRLWDASTGKLLRHWIWHKKEGKSNGRVDSGMLSLAFAPDGKSVVGVGFTSLGDGDGGATFVTFWETATGRERMRLRTAFDLAGGLNFGAIVLVLDQFAMALKFSPDGKTLALGTFVNLHVIDTATGKDVHNYSSRLCLGRTATFSKDGKFLFLGRYDGAIRILDAATGNIVRDVPAHEEGVLTLSLAPDGRTLASGSGDGTVLLWDVAEISKPAPAVKTVIGADKLEGLWKNLADSNGAKAFDAINQLATAPAVAAPFLKAKLQPIAPVDPQRLEKLLTDLNSEKFKEREAASVELVKLGDLALGELHKCLADNPRLEMRIRIEQILAKVLGPVTAPEMLRMFGAIEALEKMGTPEALQILLAVAQGAQGHRVTEDARLAAQRLKSR